MSIGGLFTFSHECFSKKGNASDGKRALQYGPAVGVVSQLGLDVFAKLGNTTLGKSEGGSHSSRLAFDPKAVWFNQNSNVSAYTAAALREDAGLLPISARAVETLVAVNDFMNEHVFPAEAEYIRNHHELGDGWQVNPVIERLKVNAFFFCIVFKRRIRILGSSQGKGVVELVSSFRERLHQSGVRANGRSDGPGGLGVRGV